MAYQPGVWTDSDYRPTLLLPSFSWGMATAPMAVAVDETWFLAQFPEAAARRVVSHTTGLGTDLLLDHTSFPSIIAIDAPDADRIPLLLYSFTGPPHLSVLPSSSTGIGTSPLRPYLRVSPSYRNFTTWSPSLNLLLTRTHEATLGWGQSPTYDPDIHPFDESVFTALTTTAATHTTWATTTSSSPAASYGATLRATSTHP